MKSLGSAQQDLQKQAERDNKRRTVEARIQERQRQQEEELAQHRKEQWRRGGPRSRSHSRSPLTDTQQAIAPTFAKPGANAVCKPWRLC